MHEKVGTIERDLGYIFSTVPGVSEHSGVFIGRPSRFAHRGSLRNPSPGGAAAFPTGGDPCAIQR